MVFPPPPGHVSGTNRDWPETWSSGVVAWGRGRPAQSCHRLLHPAVHLLIYQGPLEPVGGTSWEWVGPSLEWETRVEKREVGPGSKVRELQDLRINDSLDRILSSTRRVPKPSGHSFSYHCVISGGMEAPRITSCV